MKKKELDVGIVVIIPEELEQVLKVFGKGEGERINAVNNRFTYYYCMLKDSKSNPISVAISYVAGKNGTTEASLCVCNFCDEWTPKLMCLIGVATGIKDKTNLGDVIIPTEVIDLTRKEYENKEFTCLPKTFTLHDEINSMLKAHTQYTKLPSDFSIITDPIGSDNTLVKDESFFKYHLLRFNQSGIGCEMEAAGFIRACQIEGDIPWIIFRGIAGFGDGSLDEHQSDAAKNASIAAKLFIEEVLDIFAIRNVRDYVANRYMEDYCEKTIRKYIENGEYEKACFLNQFASRYLQITGQYATRIRFGSLTLDIANKVQDRSYYSRILIDDLGWTNYLLYLQTSTEQYKQKAIYNIGKGIESAIKQENYIIVAKGKRHLASIHRLEGELRKTEELLKSAKEYLQRVENPSEGEELEVDLTLSESKLLFEKYKKLKRKSDKDRLLRNCIEKACTAESFYEKNNDDERLIKVYKFLAQVYLETNNDDEARNYRNRQELAIQRNGRVLFW